jgi:hypothetical protein
MAFKILEKALQGVHKKYSSRFYCLSQIQSICIILNLNKFTIQQEQNIIAYLKTNVVSCELRGKDTEAVESSCEIDIVIPFYEYTVPLHYPVCLGGIDLYLP